MPCSVLDTRTQSAPLAAGETRTVPMAGSCGIPSGASAVAVNIAVVDATAQGEMTAYPANEPRPTASAISYQAVVARSNNGILKLGSITLYKAAHTVGLQAEAQITGFSRGRPTVVQMPDRSLR